MALDLHGPPAFDTAATSSADVDLAMPARRIGVDAEHVTDARPESCRAIRHRSAVADKTAAPSKKAAVRRAPDDR
ncbi:MAG: hypothetical protein IT293_01840 [Deltaproteobacteria bacterium]|nr:hypothetical protein [Deltaproteobacteria bacterium]